MANTAISSDYMLDDKLGHPIDMVSRFVTRQDWYLHRTSEDRLLAEVPGRWGQYQLRAEWQDDAEALLVRCHLELSLDDDMKGSMALLLSRLNQNLWLGYFSLDEASGSIELRHTLALRGVGGATAEQVEDVVDILLGEAEQAFPVIYRQAHGYDVTDGAAQLILMPVHGEA